MSRNLLILAGAIWMLLSFSVQSWGFCPEDPRDLGECDTLYTEVYRPDQLFEGSPPFLVRFPIYVTHDENTQPNGEPDSIAVICLALDYEFSNAAAYCSLTYHWNNTHLYPSPTADRSVFRHFIEDEDTVIHNWMMDLSQKGMGLEWDTRILDLSNQYFRLAIYPTGRQDQRFGEGSRVLLATMTFKLEDTTFICIDTSIWPPGMANFFVRSDAASYFFRHFFPVCELLGLGAPPEVHCPDDQHHHSNGQFVGVGFSSRAYSKVIQSLNAEFVGGGIGDVWFDNVVGLGTDTLEADVVYQVTDHCGSGGTITLTATDDAGATGSCDLEVTFFNNPPELMLPAAVRALSGHVLVLDIYAEDIDGDELVSFLQDFWYVSDSLRPPSYYPLCVPGNPGRLSWQITQADTGMWMFSFLAVDGCGSIDTERVAVEVGVPFCGDVNDNGLIDPGDVISLLNYLFRHGDAPQPLCRGDANCNGHRDPGDMVLLISYLFKRGVPPCFDCCPGPSGSAFTKPSSTR